MIKTFRAIHYGCLKDIQLSLQPLHVLIGPNDSGKSTLLRGIRTVVQLASSSFHNNDGKWEPFDPRFEVVPPQSMIACDVEGGWYGIAKDDNQKGYQERISEPGQPTISDRRVAYRFEQRYLNQPTSFAKDDENQAVLAQLNQARLFRFDPDALRQPSGLIPHTSKIGFLDDRGAGLPGVYQAILGRGDEAFIAIRDSVKRLFPTIKRVGVLPIATDLMVMEVELYDGTKVPVGQMSEGLLYYLAFAAVRYLDPVSVMLIEEPENGLHPARIADVVRILRAIVNETGTQIIMATHSPLVVNELEPDEVTVVTRPSLQQGTQLTPIRQTPHFDRRAKVYALGELWVSYCDGDQEKPLFEGAR